MLLLDGTPGRFLGTAIAGVVAEAVVGLCIGKRPVRLFAGGNPAEAAVIVLFDRVDAWIEAGSHAADREEPDRIVLTAGESRADTGSAVRAA